MGRRKSKAGDGKESDATMSMEGLTPEELSNLKAMKSASVPRGGGISSPEGTVSQKEHRDAVDSLRDRVDRLNSDLQGTKEALSKAKEELRQARERLEAKLAEVSELKAENDRLKSDNAFLRKERDDLKRDKDALNRRLEDMVPVADAETLRGEIGRLKEELSESKADLVGAMGEFRALQDELSEANETLASIREAAAVPAEGPRVTLGTVHRASGDTLTSDLFTSPRYRASLARDGGSMVFVPDVEGGAVCVDGAIRLPRLPSLVGFEGAGELRATVSEDGRITVELRPRRLRS